jgi:putative PIN family toxin of toxin-antitoxin system
MSREPSSGLRAVLDTNVLISMFANHPDRPIFQLWVYAVRRRYTLLLSPDIIREVVRTLRHKFAWEEPELIQLAKALAHVGELITPAITLDVIPTDPDDNRILECAVAGSAHLIVSGDRDLRHLRTYEGISIVVPRDFMRMLSIPEHL